ncbi:MAG: lipid II flippase MurJ [Desulfobacteraceae bacterium]
MGIILSTGFGTYTKFGCVPHLFEEVFSVEEDWYSVYSAPKPILESKRSLPRLIAMGQFFAAVGAATLANAVGRAANVLIPLALVGIYFLVLALAFYFYSTLSYAATEASVPISIQYDRSLSSQAVVKIGFAVATAMFLISSAICFIGNRTGIGYAAGLALMSGAGIANGFASGFLHASSRYVLTGLTWALRIAPFSLFVASRQPVENLYILAIGIGMADWLRLGLLVFMRPKASPSHQLWNASTYLKRHLSSYIPLVMAMLIMGMNPIVDRLIASISGPGSLSVLDAADRLFGIFSTLCTLGMMTVLLTRLSQAVSDKGLDRAWPSIFKMAVIWSGIWLMIGGTIGFCVFGGWIPETTPLSEFQSQTVATTYWYYLPGLIPFAISIVHIKRLQAVQRNWMLAILSSGMVLLNVVSSLGLHAALGVPGIALATTIVYTVYSVILAASAYTGRYFSFD